MIRDICALGPVYITREKIKNAALFLLFGPPAAPIRY